LVITWVGGAVVAALLSLFGLYSVFHVASAPFDAWTWKASAGQFQHNSPRQSMAQDLLAAHSPLGLTREQVIELLGPDDRGLAMSFHTEYELRYVLGRVEGQMEPDWLLIKIGPDGHVVEAIVRGY
jgi:hypothetical protein